MKKLTLLLLLGLPAMSMYRAQGDCYQGGQPVVTNGVSSTTLVEQSFPACTVTVYLTGTLTPATLFSDNMSTPLGNPFTANQNGHWFFYAANGRYDVQISGGGLSAPITYGDIALNDPGGSGVVVPTPTQQLTYLRTQPNAGNNTTLQWWPFSTAYSADYNFAAQSPGGSLTSGISNTVTLTPCPLGTNGTNPGYSMYVSGGTGTAEGVAITGGSCTSGLASGTVIFTPSNNHSGAWTIASDSGGAAEAICALPSSGGDVTISANVTLYANVGTCGKTSVTVTKQTGVSISGSFTILNATSLGTQLETYNSVNPSGTQPWMLTVDSSNPLTWAFADTGLAIGRRIDSAQNPAQAQTTLFLQEDFNGSTGTPWVLGTYLKLTNDTNSNGVAASANYVEMGSGATTEGIGVHGQCDINWAVTGTPSCIGLNAEGQSSVGGGVGVPGLIGVESNMCVPNCLGGPTVLGIQVQMNGASTSSNSAGIQVQSNTGNITPKGIYVTDLSGGSIPAPIFISSTQNPETAITLLNATVGTGAVPEQLAFYRGSVVGTNQTAAIQAINDAGDFGHGTLIFKTNNASTPTTDLTLDGHMNAIFAGHVASNITGASSDVAGTITLSSATSASFSFAQAYNFQPVCVITPTSNLGAVTYWVTANTTSVTAHTSGSASVIFTYICSGY